MINTHNFNLRLDEDPASLITSEEEARLLASDIEDDDEMDQVHIFPEKIFRNKTVETNGNSMIITVTRKRRPPIWKLGKYIPKRKSTRLFSDEIGLYSLDNSEGSISSSSHQSEIDCVTSVRITCGDNMRVIEPVPVNK